MIVAALSIAIGELVTFKLNQADSDVRCGRLAYVQQLPGGVPSGWIVETGAAPHRMVHLQLVDVRKGCAP